MIEFEEDNASRQARLAPIENNSLSENSGKAFSHSLGRERTGNFLIAADSNLPQSTVERSVQSAIRTSANSKCRTIENGIVEFGTRPSGRPWREPR
jgi:hypothetical protein